MTTIQVTVNGQPQSFDAGCTIRDILDQVHTGGPAVAVELNGDVVPREQHAVTAVAAGDAIEIVTLVGGG